MPPRTKPRRNNNRMVWTILALVIGVVALSIVTQKGNSGKSPSHPHSVVAATPVTVPTLRPTKYVAELPPLTDEQQWYKLLAGMVTNDPKRWAGVWIPDADLSDMTSNDKQVWIGLLTRENSLYQFDDNGETAEPEEKNDCRGLGQICDNPALCPPEWRWIPPVNLYCSARYFEDLVHKHSGDYTKAVAEYEGARKEDENGQLTIVDPTNTDILKIWELVKRY